MKMRVKQKSDINKTGNKKIVLKDWEIVIHEMLDGDSNLTLSRIPGGCTFGSHQQAEINPVLPAPIESELGTRESQTSENIIIEEFVYELSPPPLPPPSSSSSTPKRKRSAIDDYESEKTRPLSNGELQRLVLITQLKVLELKEKKMRKDLGEI
ncbi:uncharacterized protein [Periplaneta americana]|uniref:uncharacterized protein n=1 Tax=Periplaneta americana TaxID=6978 RepID=UPI0037E85285